MDFLKSEIIDHEKWKLTQTSNGGYLLEIKATLSIPGSIYRVNKKVFDEGKKVSSLDELITKFDLHNKFEKISTTYKRKLPPKPKNTTNKYYGKGFIATQERDRYFLEYHLAYHGGGSRKFEISKEVYEDARTGKYSTSDLFKKYDLYQLDVPKNDVK